MAVMRVLRQVGAVDLDTASAKDVTLTLQRGAGVTGLRFVAFVQDTRSGHVLGVAAQKL